MADHSKKTPVAAKKVILLVEKTDHLTYKCCICDETFHSASDIEIHLQQYHFLSECENIKRKVFEEFLGAQLTDTNEDIISIPSPEKSIEPVRKELSCFYCPRTFKSYSGRKMHLMKQHSAKLRFECSICNVGFMNRSNLMQHNTKMHLVRNVTSSHSN